MAITIHHMTAKLAKAHGFTIAVENDEVVVRDKGVIIASHHSGSIALKDAIAALEAQGSHPEPVKPAKAAKKTRAPKDDTPGEYDEEELTKVDEDAEDDGESDEGKSIVKGKYKQQYRPFKQTCGDEMAQRISAHVKVTKQVDGKSVTRIDPAKLKKFARANGCWVDDYAHLNIGQQRMNIGNRLRKLVDKDGWKVVWA